MEKGKIGTKRHVLLDQKGIPLSVIFTSANTHDMKDITNTLDNVVIKRPSINRICALINDTTFQK